MNEIKRNYEPKDFQLINDGLFLTNTLGKSEYETLAAKIIMQSQEAGKWVPLKEYSEADYRHMNETEHFEENEEGFMLSNQALEQIIEKYPAKKD